MASSTVGLAEPYRASTPSRKTSLPDSNDDGIPASEQTAEVIATTIVAFPVAHTLRGIESRLLRVLLIECSLPER